jgi:hypothetical protein
MSTESRFDDAMMDLYVRAKAEVGYTASRYHQMLMENGGLRTAQILIDADAVSDGYTRLWELKRLDLAVEALLLRPEFSELFTETQHKKARARLKDYGYVPQG